MMKIIKRIRDVIMIFLGLKQAVEQSVDWPVSDPQQLDDAETIVDSTSIKGANTGDVGITTITVSAPVAGNIIIHTAGNFDTSNVSKRKFDDGYRKDRCLKDDDTNGTAV